MITPNVVWKYLRSFFKHEWSVEDYPIRVNKFDIQPGAPGSRIKPVGAHATIVNWWQMSGVGDTEAAALLDLRANLEAHKATGKRLPRPGTGLPIEFTSSSRVEAHGRLAEDFLRRILGLNLAECFISDESSLWDFHDGGDNTQFYNKILLIYGVDVSDIEGARLCDIFDHLVAHGVSV